LAVKNFITFHLSFVICHLSFVIARNRSAERAASLIVSAA